MPSINDLMAWSKYYNKNKCELRVSGLFDELCGISETMQLDLIFCEKKYFVTDGNAISPRGVNVSDRIFLKNRINFICKV